mmetsp:Transcript_52918/g.123869  ORF Transcript_52918/g.123869 Transcript_52918/m.123869 type:complete len:193 (-) Transcript_52918:265-843(-)
MSKQCDKCGNSYAGFGTTCSECRKTKGSSAPAAPATGDGNHCVVCKKVAYAMEKIQVEGETFHSTCFRCEHCNNKLSPGNFRKSIEGKYYCKVHYEALFKLRGKYDFPGGQKLEHNTSNGEAQEAVESKAVPEQAVEAPVCPPAAPAVEEVPEDDAPEAVTSAEEVPEEAPEAVTSPEETAASEPEPTAVVA